MDLSLMVISFFVFDFEYEWYFVGELFQVLKMMVGSNLKDSQLQQIVDKVKTKRENYFLIDFLIK